MRKRARQTRKNNKAVKAIDNSSRHFHSSTKKWKISSEADYNCSLFYFFMGLFIVAEGLLAVLFSLVFNVSDFFFVGVNVDVVV